MNGQIFWLVFLIVFGAIVCISGLLIRVRPADRSAIDNFAEQHGLRIISVTPSYNIFRYWSRGISGGDVIRSYKANVENSEGNRGNIHVAFDSLFDPEQLVMREQQGLTLTPQGGSISLAQPDSGTTRLSWDERLVLFVVGACIGGFFFCGILQTDLSPPNRPVFPEPALGYTHLFKAKYGNVYGTFFEYVAVTYGVWIMWGLAAVSGLFFNLKIRQKSRTYRRYPWQILAAAAISMALYYAIWRVSIHVAQS
jgi:hypothetical protein